ncbi:PREDICTED: E3 ubiquitin-protein ligase RING1 [Theobroma cacao]|uniref:RING-type E3 ubiquitin transferase n=1 Tax=Theobroma cacao TaxID=3641 RepID=A0AB32W239_THECC|nr:PREDICTED: E3 ubiquitin-protein ligase RING1 [Theobroma cacao]
MGFRHRKLMSDSTDETSPDYCEDCSRCYTSCYNLCPLACYKDRYPPPVPVSDPASDTKTPNKLLIITFTVLAAAFLVLCYYIYYVRCSRGRSNARRRSQPQTTETRDEFLDEDHGPIIDHPFWYINTVGLQPSIINSITVCKYKRGEGLVEGTECSVCLNEFEEDETLRLLPKCSHAFHIPCIDTWLRSHTNCPMCRAPIVFNTVNRGPSSSEVNTEDSAVTEETQVIIMEDDGEQHERETEGGTRELRVRPEQEEELAVENERKTGESSGVEDGIQPMRRSVSLDSLAASQISHAIANGFPEGSSGNSDNELAKGKESSVRIVTRRTAGNQGLLRLMCHSSIGRSLQSRPIFMKRSFSCNGKFSLPICNNNRNKNPPLRSF